MRIVRPTLMGLTLGLAAVSVYLATVVADERERAQNAAQQRREVTVHLEQLVAAQPKATPAAESTGGDGPPAAVSTPTSEAPADEEEIGDVGYAEYQSDRLRKLTDPTARSALRIQYREQERDTHPGLVDELRLSASDADELFAILAEQGLRHEERGLRNQIAGRDEFIDRREIDVTARKELTALLGADGFRKLHEYRDIYPERQRIDALHERLGKSDAFTADEASQLTEVMRQERAAFEREVQRLPGKVRFNSGWPETARLRGVEREARLKFDEAHIARTAAHHARIRERASAFLSPVQMQRLRQLHDERIASDQSSIIWSRYLAPARDALQEAEAAARKKK